MMLGVLLSNADNVLVSIANFRQSLDMIESALLDENRDALQIGLDNARRQYQIIAT